MNICVYGASSSTIDKSFIKSGEKLGGIIAERGHTVVYGGGANGMMGAVARGCRNKNGNVVGIAPSFFKVDGSLYDNCTEFIYPENMRDRKRMLEERSDAFIVTPGGIGTFDEFFEILTLKQLDRHFKAIALYNIDGFYDRMLDMIDFIVEKNFMTAKSKKLYFVSNEPEEIINYLENYKPERMKLSELKDVK